MREWIPDRPDGALEYTDSVLAHRRPVVSFLRRLASRGGPPGQPLPSPDIPTEGGPLLLGRVGAG